jgi:sigma-B regulation protein RsbU (phosphoserine phosphatase)
VAYEQTLLNEQKPLEQFPEINRLFAKTADFPLPEAEVVEFASSSHLFVGLKGSTTNSIRFCVLYPVERIDAKIRAEAKELIYPTVLGISLVFFMIVILHLNLLMPVKRLHQAALALENRDSTFRLPESDGDEFAEMAKIFNNSISEFDELKIASIVQARLLPNRPFNVEGFSIFGKSLPMIELGGDYFDYFPVDDTSFALLLGDVAGHGVGASLIMAMAKAGVICSSEIARDPASALGRLHQIVFSIKNRVQRKVMTFQYLLVNRLDRSLVYSNAGGCSPALIDPATKTVSEIKHAGAVLGGFKKSVYSNLKLAINPGQAIILYTDGMVESRNERDIELGYQGLFDLFLACYDQNATTYYNSIMTSYQNWLGQATAGDDITLIVMVCA